MIIESPTNTQISRNLYRSRERNIFFTIDWTSNLWKNIGFSISEISAISKDILGNIIFPCNLFTQAYITKQLFVIQIRYYKRGLASNFFELTITREIVSRLDKSCCRFSPVFIIVLSRFRKSSFVKSLLAPSRRPPRRYERFHFFLHSCYGGFELALMLILIKT